MSEMQHAFFGMFVILGMMSVTMGTVFLTVGFIRKKIFQVKQWAKDLEISRGLSSRTVEKCRESVEENHAEVQKALQSYNLMRTRLNDLYKFTRFDEITEKRKKMTKALDDIKVAVSKGERDEDGIFPWDDPVHSEPANVKANE